jgi:hypothetical protein
VDVAKTAKLARFTSAASNVARSRCAEGIIVRFTAAAMKPNGEKKSA